MYKRASLFKKKKKVQLYFVFKCKFELWFSFSLMFWLNRCITAFRHQIVQKVFALLLFFLSWTNQSISLPAGQARGYYCMHSPPSVICLWSIKTKENWSKGQKVIFSHLEAIPSGVFMGCYHFQGKITLILLHHQTAMCTSSYCK